MFKPRKKPSAARRGEERVTETNGNGMSRRTGSTSATWSRSSPSSSLSSSLAPARARYGDWVGAFGMTVALVATFFTAHLTNFASVLIVMAIAAPVGGAPRAR